MTSSAVYSTAARTSRLSWEKVLEVLSRRISSMLRMNRSLLVVVVTYHDALKIVLSTSFGEFVFYACWSYLHDFTLQHGRSIDDRSMEDLYIIVLFFVLINYWRMVAISLLLVAVWMVWASHVSFWFKIIQRDFISSIHGMSTSL